jgi:hypothetical protein
LRAVLTGALNECKREAIMKKKKDEKMGPPGFKKHEKMADAHKGKHKKGKMSKSGNPKSRY